jgi:hypothetical protein
LALILIEATKTTIVSNEVEKITGRAIMLTKCHTLHLMKLWQVIKSSGYIPIQANS